MVVFMLLMEAEILLREVHSMGTNSGRDESSIIWSSVVEGSNRDDTHTEKLGPWRMREKTILSLTSS